MENKIYTQKAIIKAAMKEFEARMQKKGIQGLSTGHSLLDEHLNGLQARLYVLAARPSVGKSAFAMQIAEHVSQTAPVGVISLEMQPVDLVFRSLARISRIPLSAIHKGEVIEINKITNAFTKISNNNIYYDFNSFNINLLEKSIDKMCKDLSCKLIIIDHLQLTFANINQRNFQLETVMKLFLQKRKEYSIPFLILSQLNRASDKEDREPQLSDLRDSGSIEQDADVVMFLHKLEDCPVSGGDIISLSIKKGRNELTGKIKYRFISKYMFFEELI